jgi:N-dimethylarginine dimethylaminohydrolase
MRHVTAGPPDLHQRRMESAAEPPFLDELESVWGARWGAWDEVGPLRRVLVRAPGDELSVVRADAYDEEAQALVDPDGRWYWTGSEPPDLDLVHSQHAGLVAALEREGVQVDVAQPMGGAFVKSVYVRDPLITVPGGAIVGRMGVRMRRGEEPDITRTVAAIGLPILGTLTGTATLEGGSFVKLDAQTALFGLSIRCNQPAADQLAAMLARVGMELIVVPLAGYTIHLDLHLAMVDVDKALVDVPGLPYWFLEYLEGRGIEAIAADPSEEWGLNALCVSPGRVLMAAEAPRSAERLAARGVEVIPVEYGELHKNGGGVHCSTMELLREPAS